MRKPKGLGIRFIDLPRSERRRIVNLVFEEAEAMKNQKGRVNYNELSRKIYVKTGIHLWPAVIRSWIIGEKTPMKAGSLKAIRQPPDEDGQIVRGLIETDLHRHDAYNTLWLSIHTTKDFYAYSLQKFFLKYGWSDVKPTLIKHTPEWRMSAYLDYDLWFQELQKPIDDLSQQEKMKLLSGLITGDGWITIMHTERDQVSFVVCIGSSRKHKIQFVCQVLDSMSIPYSTIKIRRRGREQIIGDILVKTKAYYEYVVAVSAKNAVLEILTHTKLLQPFREIKRKLALKFIHKGKLKRAAIKPVWDWLRLIEKASTVRSQIRACELIRDEKFARKNLDKQQMLKHLHEKLREYTDKTKELKPIATRIISNL